MAIPDIFLIHNKDTAYLSAGRRQKKKAVVQQTIIMPSSYCGGFESIKAAVFFNSKLIML